MKTFILTLLLFTTFTFTSCVEDLVDDLTKFDIKRSSTFVVPGISIRGLPNISTPDVKFSFDNAFSIEDQNKNLVENASLTEVLLSIKDPINEDFSFLESIEVYISAEGLQESRIAWKENINSQTESTLYLETNKDINLEAYIKKDEFVLTSVLVTDELIAQDHEIQIDFNIFVDAEILGI